MKTNETYRLRISTIPTLFFVAVLLVTRPQFQEREEDSAFDPEIQVIYEMLLALDSVEDALLEVEEESGLTLSLWGDVIQMEEDEEDIRTILGAYPLIVPDEVILLFLE